MTQRLTNNSATSISCITPSAGKKLPSILSRLCCWTSWVMLRDIGLFWYDSHFLSWSVVRIAVHKRTSAFAIMVIFFYSHRKINVLIVMTTRNLNSLLKRSRPISVTIVSGKENYTFRSFKRWSFQPSLVGSFLVFYKIKVTAGLNDAVITGTYPAMETIVFRHIPRLPRRNSEGMRLLDNRSILIRFQAFR